MSRRLSRGQFITGNGPRYLVCVRCGVDEGYVTEDEVPQLYDSAIVKSRYTVIARRYAPWFWLLTGWTLWGMFFAGTPLWGNAALVVLIISTLGIPVIHLLGGAKYQAQLRRLTP